MGNCLESCRDTLITEEVENLALHRSCMKCKQIFWEDHHYPSSPTKSSKGVSRAYVCARCLGGLCAPCRASIPSNQKEPCLHCSAKQAATPANTPCGSARRFSGVSIAASPSHGNSIAERNIAPPSTLGSAAGSIQATGILVPLVAGSTQQQAVRLGGSTPTSASGSLPGVSRLSCSSGGIGESTLQSVPSSSSLRRQVPLLRYRKICILGPACVGKSSIVTRYCEDRFSSYHTPNHSSQTQKSLVLDRVHYSLTLLDTGGQDDAPAFQPEWSIGTHAYALIFSVTDYSSFEALNTMYEQLIEVQHNGSNVPIILCGNKCDVGVGERQVSYAEGYEKAQRWGCCGYIECSAKLGSDVSSIFTRLLQSMGES